MATKKKAAPRKRSAKRPPTEETAVDRLPDYPGVAKPESPKVALPADGTLLRRDGDPVVYVMHEGQRRPFADLETFHECCGGGATIAAFPHEKIEPIPVGEIVTGASDLQ